MSSIFSINQDSFIYAVRQALDARSHSKTGFFNSHLKYTPFLDNSWEKPEVANLEELKPILKEILIHHWNAIPHYKRGEKVNLENISWFAHSIACLYADIAYLLKETLNHEFLEKNQNSKQFWDIITTEMNDICKEYALLFHIYTDWKHAPKEVQEVKVDWNVRPPCGLLYKTQFKDLFDEIRENKFGKKNTDKKTVHQKDEKKYKTSPQQTSVKHRNSTKHHKDQNVRQKSHQSSEETVNAARDECLGAIKTMQKNKNISEIPLSAQNSFIRREQHTLITEAGFYTDSRGEGANRHVCILRNPLPQKTLA